MTQHDHDIHRSGSAIEPGGGSRQVAGVTGTTQHRDPRERTAEGIRVGGESAVQGERGPRVRAELIDDDRSLGDLFVRMTGDLSTLFRKEVELAKTEGREELHRAGSAAAFYGIALEAAMFGLIMLSFALAWVLDEVIDRALSFLIVGAVWWVVAIATYWAGAKRKEQVQPLPTTTQTIKEDIEWAKTRRN